MAGHIHFIGIGGIGVSALAQLAIKKGYRVSGSDIKSSAITLKLSGLGADVFIGHRRENVAGADLVVYSSAIRQDNPEMEAARTRGITLQRRAEFLSDLMSRKTVITVTGAHGKTTTSSLAAKLLVSAGLHPTVAVGGILRECGENIQYGESAYFVAEADESDGTFLCYAPDYSIITNVDREHMDYYGTHESLVRSFETFIRQTKPGGCVIYFADDPVLKKIVDKARVRAVGYGWTSQADLRAEKTELSQCRLAFDAVRNGVSLGHFAMGLAGRHNIANALAVVALGMEMGLDPDITRRALRDFKGVHRRFDIKVDSRDIFVVDDYAHHPTEIAATIEAAKLCARKRLIVVFQPHRFSRTRDLLNEFPGSFEKSDVLIVTDIYGAGEDPLEGVSAQGLIEAVKRHSRVPVDYVAKDGIVGYLKRHIRKDDLVLFLGAGDITKISDEFARSLQS